MSKKRDQAAAEEARETKRPKNDALLASLGVVDETPKPEAPRSAEQLDPPPRKKESKKEDDPVKKEDDPVKKESEAPKKEVEPPKAESETPKPAPAVLDLTTAPVPERAPARFARFIVAPGPGPKTVAAAPKKTAVLSHTPRPMARFVGITSQ